VLLPLILTVAGSEAGDERADSTHGILMTSDALPEDAVQSARDMFKQYYPIEQSPTLTPAEKLPFMIEWCVRLFGVRPSVLVVRGRDQEG
jgi:hypothetical protein